MKTGEFVLKFVREVTFDFDSSFNRIGLKDLQVNKNKEELNLHLKKKIKRMKQN